MIDFRNRGRGYRFSVRIQMPPTVVTEPDRFDVLVFCNGTELARQRFAVRAMERCGKPPGK